MSADPRRAELDARVLAWMREPLARWRADDTRFDALARDLFAFHFANCEPYRRFCERRGRTPQSVATWREIPAVPAGAFKEMALRSFPAEREQHVFRTSGTSTERRGELHLDTLELYEASLLPSFRRGVLPDLQAGSRARLRVLAPPPEEAPDSSLSHMLGIALRELGDAASGFDVRGGALQVDATIAALEQATRDDVPIALCGTAFAFVHLLDALAERGARMALPATSRVMETGGFKGRAREMPREALYLGIEHALGVSLERVVNQYGMTELGSQFYDSILDQPAAAAPETRTALGARAPHRPGERRGRAGGRARHRDDHRSREHRQCARDPDRGPRPCDRRRLRSGRARAGRRSARLLDRRRRDAGVSAAEVRAAHARLRDARRLLRERSPADLHASLGDVLDAWSAPHSPWQEELVAALPATSGFSAAMVREGVARGLAPYTGAALHALVRDELGDAARLAATRGGRADGFATTATVLAGAIPLPTFVAIVAPLALRSPVLVKPAAHDPISAPLFARSLGERDPLLGACVEIAAFHRGDAEALAALCEAECVVATGSDAAVEAVRAAGTPRRFAGYGHRESIAVLGPDATRGAALAAAAASLALDVALWDQLGCLSPLVVHVAGSDRSAASRVGEALGEALADAESRWPRGAVEASVAAAITRERAEAEMRGAPLFASKGTEWSVVVEADAQRRAAPLHRFVRVSPSRDVDACLAALEAQGARLQGVALAGFGDEQEAIATALARLGASRICAPGELQSPPLAWPRDNLPVLLPLARFAAIETE